MDGDLHISWLDNASFAGDGVRMYGCLLDIIRSVAYEDTVVNKS